jgi:uncharacterized protein with beta-barrel porin domain
MANLAALKPLTRYAWGILVAVAIFGTGNLAGAATYTVTNTFDSGPGSLRAALGNAVGGDTIEFDADLAGGIISLQTPLDTLDVNLTLNATTAPGLRITGSPFVIDSGATVSFLGDATLVGDVDVVLGALVMQGNISGDTTVATGSQLTLFGTLNGDVTVDAGGTLVGDIVVGNGRSFSIAGSVIGDTTVRSGGALVLTGTLVGDVTVETGGTLAGNIVVRNSQSFLIAGTVTGDTTIRSGGTLNLTGTLGGNVTIDSGGTLVGDIVVGAMKEYQVNGILNGGTVIQQGGTLSGSGTITGITTSNGRLNARTATSDIATLAFGNDLNINGGTMQVDVNAGGTEAGVNNDLYTVNGDVGINGGTLEIKTISANFLDGVTYTFLQSTGTISGAFDSIIDDLPFFEMSMFYLENSVSFRINEVDASFEQIATGCNQASVGAYLDYFKPIAVDDLNDVIDALRRSNTAQVRAGLDQLGGQIYPTLINSQLQQTSFSLAMLRDQLVLDNLHRQTDVGSRAWVRGYGIGGDTEQDSCGTQGYTYSLGGTEIALQRGFEGGVDLGVFTNLSWSRVNTGAVGQRADVEGVQLGGTAQYTGDFVYVLGIGGAGYQEYDVNRNISIAGGMVDRVARSKFDGQQGFGYFESGLILATGAMNWSPYSSIQFISVDQGDVRETGAGSVNLVGRSLSTDSVRSILGLSLQESAPTGLGLATTKVRIGWMHEYADTNERFEARFIDEDRFFEVQGVDHGRDWAVIGCNLQWALFQHSTALFAYQGQANTYQALHAGALGIEVRW